LLINTLGNNFTENEQNRRKNQKRIKFALLLDHARHAIAAEGILSVERTLDIKAAAVVIRPRPGGINLAEMNGIFSLQIIASSILHFIRKSSLSAAFAAVPGPDLWAVAPQSAVLLDCWAAP
jgi:hypothetical protein